MKSARPSNAKTSAPKQGDSNKSATFKGTENPRILRVIQGLSVRPQTREHIDLLAGCANGPDLVAELRRRGLSVPCTRTRKLDRDLFDCWPGVYHLTQADRHKVSVWKRKRAEKRGQA